MTTISYLRLSESSLTSFSLQSSNVSYIWSLEARDSYVHKRNGNHSQPHHYDLLAPIRILTEGFSLCSGVNPIDDGEAMVGAGISSLSAPGTVQQGHCVGRGQKAGESKKS